MLNSDPAKPVSPKNAATTRAADKFSERRGALAPLWACYRCNY